jgi:hypothetical protein
VGNLPHDFGETATPEETDLRSRPPPKMVNNVSTKQLISVIKSATERALDHWIQDRHGEPDRQQLHEILRLADTSASVLAMVVKAAGQAFQEAQPTIHLTGKKLQDAKKQATKAAIANITGSLMDMASTKAIASGSPIASSPFRLVKYSADKALEMALSAERVARSAASSSSETREQAAKRMDKR